MDFNIKLKPESQKILDGLAKAGNIDLRPTLKVIGIGYRKEVEAIFNKQQPRGEGLRWPQLSPEYAAQKAKDFPGQPILVRTGLLKSSMITEGATGNITVISKSGAVFGSSIAYGIYHDSDEGRSSNLPRRNFSEPSQNRIEIWTKQLTKDIAHNFEVNGIRVSGGEIVL